jgi:pyrroloquinoline-quinone synthase
MDLWQRLDEVADRWNVLSHPFYQRWSEGKLSRPELAFYAGQYAHAVNALAAASRQAADAAPAGLADELASHAAEEEAHVGLWRRFAEAAGSEGDAAALPETADCAAAWSDSDRELLPTLVALYAIESAQPAISDTKRAGLIDHYGFSAGSGTEYFDVHVVRDVEHAESGRALIESSLDGADADALVAEAERVLQANWTLLDGVERAHTDAGSPPAPRR